MKGIPLFAHRQLQMKLGIGGLQITNQGRCFHRRIHVRNTLSIGRSLSLNNSSITSKTILTGLSATLKFGRQKNGTLLKKDSNFQPIVSGMSINCQGVYRVSVLAKLSGKRPWPYLTPSTPPTITPISPSRFGASRGFGSADRRSKRSAGLAGPTRG